MNNNKQSENTINRLQCTIQSMLKLSKEATDKINKMSELLEKDQMSELLKEATDKISKMSELLKKNDIEAMLNRLERSDKQLSGSTNVKKTKLSPKNENLIPQNDIEAMLNRLERSDKQLSGSTNVKKTKLSPKNENLILQGQNLQMSNNIKLPEDIRHKIPPQDQNFPINQNQYNTTQANQNSLRCKNKIFDNVHEKKINQLYNDVNLYNANKNPDACNAMKIGKIKQKIDDINKDMKIRTNNYLILNREENISNQDLKELQAQVDIAQPNYMLKLKGR